MSLYGTGRLAGNVAGGGGGGGGGSGTVTSVGMTVPSFLAISGSPVTTSGTLAVSLSGTSLAIPAITDTTGGSTAQVRLTDQTIHDSGGTTRVDFSNTVDTGGVLNDELGNVAVGFSTSNNLTGRGLFSDEGNIIVDFQNGSLSGNAIGGAVFAGSTTLTANGGFTKINWGSGLLRDTTPSTQLSWTTSGVGLPKLTASRALVLDGSNIIASSGTTATELGYVSGVTSAIQTQLNAKRADAYTPGNAAKWAAPVPTTIQQAIDRIAAVVGNTIPIPV